MKNILQDCRTNLNALFQAPAIYVFISLFLFVSGLFFSQSILVLNGLVAEVLAKSADIGTQSLPSLSDLVVSEFFRRLTLILAIAVPLLGLYAPEQHKTPNPNGLDALRNSIGRFFVLYVALFMMVLPTAGGFAMLRELTSDFEMVPAAAGYIAVLFFMLAWTSAANFFTSVIKTSYLAVGLALATLMFLAGKAWMGNVFSSEPSSWLESVGLMADLSHFLRGVIAVKILTAQLLAAIFFLVLTILWRSDAAAVSKPLLVIQSLIVIIVFFFAFSFNAKLQVKFSLSADKAESLRFEVRKILESHQKARVHAMGFFEESSAENQSFQDLAKNFARVIPGFTYETINPDHFPAKAREYNVDSFGTIVFESSGKHKHARVISQDSFSYAIQDLDQNGGREIIFLKGHDEASITDQTNKGASVLSDELRKAGFDPVEKNIDEIKNDDKPDLFILIGPHTDLLDFETEFIQSRLFDGQRFFIAIDPVAPGEGKKMEGLMWQLGLDLREDVVIDRFSQTLGGDSLVPVIQSFASEAWMRRFKAPVFFPVARSVQARTGWDTTKVTELAFTGLTSWAEADLASLESGKVKFDEGIDVRGPIGLMALVSDKKSGGSMLISGDSDWLTNEYLRRAGNRDFAVWLIDTLTHERSAFDLFAPPEKKEVPFTLSPRGQLLIYFYPSVLTPLAYLLFACATWFVRKRSA